MEMKFAQVVNKGMQRDYAMNTASQEFAYENKNIRITTTGNESFLAITNEKSTKKIEIINNDVHFWWETDDYEIVYEDGVPTFRKCTIKIKAFKDYTGYINLAFGRDGNIKNYIVEIPSQEEDKYIDLSLDAFINRFYNEFGKYPYAYGIEISNVVGYKKNKRDHPEIHDEKFYLEGLVATIPFNDYIVFFCQEKDCTYIYRGSIEQNSDDNDYYIDLKLLYSGDLNLSVDNPIEYTTSYESDDVQKIYWVDGVNQPRIINICKLNQNKFTSNLDFVPKIEGNIKVNVEKQYEGRGNFPSGVIQYYITYYNKFGQESNAVCVTPLYNISPSDRGGTEEETQTCSFKIRIENVDIHYDNIRIYSFIRTTLDGDPIVSIVGDLNIEKDKPNQYYEIIDDNYGNINVPATDILFLGGNTISASTIEQKDNTLFLGNISSIVNNDDHTSLKEQLKNNRNNGEDGLSFVSRPIEDKEIINTDYGYAPNMDNNSKDRGFKYLEWYRFGLQFQSDTGEWSNTLWINDKQNDLKPNIIKYDTTEDVLIKELYDKADNFYSLAAVKYKPDDSIKNIIKKYNSKYYRLVMAEHNSLSRTIKTQGVVLPTLFNLKQRYDNTVFGSPIWSIGMLANKEHYHNVDNTQMWYDIEDNNWYLINNPQQQLDSAIYSLHPNYPTHETPNVTEEDILYWGVSSRILPSASMDKSLQNITQDYLSALDIRVRVIRGIPNQNHVSGSPHGDGVVQDIFDVSITPIVKSYRGQIKDGLRTYIIREYRLAGKRKKTYETFFSLVASKTWRDYVNYTGVNISNIDFIDLNDNIIFLNELPDVNEFHDNAKQKDYSQSYRIHRNASPSKDLATVERFASNYFIDANTCNMWSPNIEELYDTESNFRLIGELTIENTMSDYDIVLQQNAFNGKIYTQYEGNFNRYVYNNVNTGISSFPLWPKEDNCLFWTYLWSQNTIGKDSATNFVVKNKTFGNLWKTNSLFFDNDNIIDYGNTYYRNCNDNTLYMEEKLYKQEYQNILFPSSKRKVYLSSGNKDLTPTTDFNTINALINENSNIAMIPTAYYVEDAINIKYSSTPHLVFNLGNNREYINVLPNYKMTHSEYQGRHDVANKESYPLNTPIIHYCIDVETNGGKYLFDCINEIYDHDDKEFSADARYDNNIHTIIPENAVVEKVSQLDFKTNGWEYPDHYFNKGTTILLGSIVLEVTDSGPLNDSGYYKLSFNINDKLTSNKIIASSEGSLHKIIENSIQKIESNSITLTGFVNDSINKNTKLFLGEFYADYDPSTFMGGNTENALELNTFIPISDPTPIGETIYGFEGDTYYQQWDCLRIYPTSEDDVNKVVDVVSVMLETHKNLDGDTRKARGRADVINIRPDNMVDQINPIYSQSNNYVTSKIIDEKFEDSTHPLQYWWSLTKSPNSDIDIWTGVNLTSVAELDGDKGPLNKIKRWNNQLFAFQDKAIALINFNNQTTIATQEGLPVEIQNSGKVSGHYYITTNNGCKNKWSIVESPNGLYFIDSYNKSINVIGDGIKSLSQLNLFQDWIEQKERGNVWTPSRKISAFKSFYDPIHKEVYFANGEDCLCYNELLQQFTSFYDYQDMNHMFMIDNHIYSIPKDNKLYLMFEGENYCNLYDKQCDYYMQYKINNEPFIDKTWTNLEYRADIFDRGNIQTNEFNTNDIVSNETFDLLKVWNEYQSGELDLTKIKFGYLKDAKPKFRIWRTNLPRAKSTTSNKFGLDRIRNPWIMLELKKTEDTSKRMEFHDLIIKYVI